MTFKIITLCGEANGFEWLYEVNVKLWIETSLVWTFGEIYKKPRNLFEKQS